MNKDRPFQTARFAVVDLADNLLGFELLTPVGWIEEKHGIMTVHLSGICTKVIDDLAPEGETVAVEPVDPTGGRSRE